MVLSPRDRQRLLRFQQVHSRRLGVSIGLPQLKLAMNAPFSWETLQRALAGQRIMLESYNFIVGFLEEHCPPLPGPAPADYKARAAGEREEPEAETVTHRGSR
jgi:hypothetical protein